MKNTVKYPFSDLPTPFLLKKNSKALFFGHKMQFLSTETTHIVNGT